MLLLIDFQKVHRRFHSPLRPQSSSKNPNMTEQTSKHAASSDRYHRPSASNARVVAADDDDKKKTTIKVDIIGGGTYKSPQKATPNSDSLESPGSTDTEKTNQR
jgi:hypothetical protein